MDETAARALIADLARAAGVAATLAGDEPLGVRAVEPATGTRSYLCALSGRRFLCLDSGFTVETSARRVREVAAGALLCERATSEVDVEALQALAASAGRLLARGSEVLGLDEQLQALAASSLRLSAWAAAPAREIASVPEIDEASRRHEDLRRAYGAFVAATDPLVERQDELPDELVQALREIEERVGAAGVGSPLATRLGDWMGDCDEGASEIVAAHLTPLAERDSAND